MAGSAAERMWKQAMRMVVVVSMVAAATATALATSITNEDAAAYPLTFPVAGAHTYADTYGAPRSGGRSHRGADIFADKGTPVVAAADGTIEKVALGERSGRYIAVRHSDGWRSLYLHLDNDTPGTDDGLGGAPAPGITAGAKVKAGDVLDYVGDSGNAEGTPSHLHFELHRPDGTPINPTPHLRIAEATSSSGLHAPGTERSTAVNSPTYRTVNTEVVGRFDPGGGFAAGVTVYAGVAYLGTWGRAAACPASGVRIIDVADPEAPELIGSIASGAEFPGTSTDSIWVGEVDTPSFAGALAIVAVRLCDTSERHRAGKTFRGLAFYDVTDPASPVLLGSVDSGQRTQGVHEIAAAMRDDGTLLVGVTVMQSLLHTNGELGDLRLLDATDPRAPTEVADWDFRRDGPQTTVDRLLGLVDEVDLHVHSLWLAEDGMSAWLATWDAGVVRLDLESIAAPTLNARVGFTLGSEGNAHTVVLEPETGVLIRSQEDLYPDETSTHVLGWGGQTFFDTSEPGEITPLATFVADAAAPADGVVDTSGFFSAHEVVTSDGVEYVSWYSAGLRIVDLSDPSHPEEIGSFVPPPARDPQAHWVAPDGTTTFAMVWGVAVDGDLIYLSDMHTGLWIVRRVLDTDANLGGEAGREMQ